MSGDIVTQCGEQPAADDDCLAASLRRRGNWISTSRWSKRLGYDFERGRIDKTHHPF